MRCKFIAALIVVNSAFASSGKAPDPGSAPSHRKPKGSAKVYKPPGPWSIGSVSDTKKVPGSTAVVKAGVIFWDLNGAILDGSNQRGKCDDNENNEPIFRANTPLVVKNGFIRNAKNAMTFSDKNSGVERMTWLNVCEDAVATNKGAENVRVIDSEFINLRNGDKSIQLNEAKGAIVKGNLVYAGRTCMRIGASDVTSVSDVAAVTGNRFIGCETAIHASKITVSESGNKFEKVNQPRKESNGAKFK